MIVALDTGPLSAFAESSHLGVLELAFTDADCVYPPAVHAELAAREEIHRLIVQAKWLRIGTLTEEEEWDAALIKSRLGGRPHQNLGEAQCLSLIKSRGGAALIDDSLRKKDPTKLAQADRPLTIIRSLQLIRQLALSSRITKSEGIRVIDDLISTGYRLPVVSGRDVFRG